MGSIGRVNADVIVVGAGVAGLAAGRTLAEEGLCVVIVEARDRVGGRIWTIRDFAGIPVEAGAEFIHGDDAATWPEVRAAGLRVERHRKNPFTWLNVGGHTHWMPVHLIHPGEWPAFGIYRALRHVEDGDQTATAFMAAKGYRGRSRESVELMLTGHFPGSAEEVGVRELLADGVVQLDLARDYRVPDGYDRLPGHLAHGLDVRLQRCATGITWGAQGASVTTSGGDTYAGAACITTLPHGVIASGAVAFDPPLPAAKSNAIATIKTGPVVKVLLHFDRRFWPRKMSQLVCGRGPVLLYWPHSHDVDGPRLLTGYATGARALALSRIGSERAIAVVLDDLARFYPGANPHQSVLDARLIDWPSDPYARGGYTYLPPGALGARETLAAPDTGALAWAGGATVSSPIADSVGAAYASGLRAAQQVRDRLRAGT